MFDDQSEKRLVNEYSWSSSSKASVGSGYISSLQVCLQGVKVLEQQDYEASDTCTTFDVRQAKYRHRNQLGRKANWFQTEALEKLIHVSIRKSLEVHKKFKYPAKHRGRGQVFYLNTLMLRSAKTLKPLTDEVDNIGETLSPAWHSWGCCRHIRPTQTLLQTKPPVATTLQDSSGSAGRSLIDSWARP